MLEWRIYYVDGSTFDSSMGAWEDAPLDGVLGVNERSEKTGRRTLQGRDYYFRPPSRLPVVEESFCGLTDNLGPTLRAWARWIKWGLYVGSQTMERALHRMADDPDFLPASGVEKDLAEGRVP